MFYVMGFLRLSKWVDKYYLEISDLFRIYVLQDFLQSLMKTFSISMKTLCKSLKTLNFFQRQEHQCNAKDLYFRFT